MGIVIGAQGSSNRRAVTEVTSGGKGLHVVVPIRPTAAWPQTKALAAEIAARMRQAQPQMFVEKFSKRLRQGRIYVDYLRNSQGATCIAPYSTRARPEASVSMPLAWSAARLVKGPDEFTIDSAIARLRGKPAWPEFFKLG